MIAALLATLVLGAPDRAEEASYEEIRALAAAAAPEPDPPAGVRAPADTERHRRAVAEYREALREWRDGEAKRRRRLTGLCTAHLERFPRGARRLDVLYVRGVARLRNGEYAAARPDLEAVLAAGGEATMLRAVRAALVSCCRAMGDYRAALRHAGPAASPDLMEEAGEIARAIAAAKAAGHPAKAARWALIGSPYPKKIKFLGEAKAMILEAGRRLPDEVKEALRRDFGEKNLAFGFTSAQEPAIYLLDGKGTVRAVDPRADTLTHRIRHILGAD